MLKLTNLELKAWNTSGFFNLDVTSEVYKIAFGLSVSVKFELNQTAMPKPFLDISGLGFTAAYACSCAEDTYVDIESMATIEIMARNTENQEGINVTDNFAAYSCLRVQQIKISDIFEDRNEFQLDF